ncbi:MAG: ATP-binding protein [Oligoflexia bacterium]|nr:ATP-binding protein [Oligoflexia bacterium]
MKIFERYISTQVKKDLKKKMVFIGGPRQVGKTTFAKSLKNDYLNFVYLNWDISKDREKILSDELPAGDLYIFDEIHKYKKWRNYLKGFYDQFAEEKKILVTGSAKLDYYRRGGDSLQGRYHFLRMYPLSVAELKISNINDLKELLNYGGFPEPFFSQSKIESARWSREYRTRLIREDLASLEKVEDLDTLEKLLIHLPKYVGSPLSINSLRENLQVAHKTVDKWIKIFERLYAIFRLDPFGNKTLRNLSKAKKHYHFDWTLVKNEGAKFENLLALHLLKWCHFIQDTEGRDVDLKYFRDVDGREIDFVITEDDLPTHFIDCKWAESEINPSLNLLKNKFPKADFYQISAIGNKDYLNKNGIRVCNAITFLKNFL